MLIIEEEHKESRARIISKGGLTAPLKLGKGKVKWNDSIKS